MDDSLKEEIGELIWEFVDTFHSADLTWLGSGGPGSTGIAAAGGEIIAVKLGDEWIDLKPGSKVYVSGGDFDDAKCKVKGTVVEFEDRDGISYVTNGRFITAVKQVFDDD